MSELLKVDIAGWKAEIADVQSAHYAKFGSRIPRELLDQLDAITNDWGRPYNADCTNIPCGPQPAIQYFLIREPTVDNLFVGILYSFHTLIFAFTWLFHHLLVKDAIQGRIIVNQPMDFRFIVHIHQKRLQVTETGCSASVNFVLWCEISY